MGLPGVFPNPMQELEKGYEKQLEQCSNLVKLYEYAPFRDFFKMLEQRRYTLRDFAMSDITAPDVRERCRNAANEVERLLNTFYSAIGKYEEIMNPLSRLNRDVEYHKAEVIAVVNQDRRP